MAYIYKITNKINGKIYIGKTLNNIESRFKEHVKDSKKESEQNRPLYRAFNKYGIENFDISLLEETSNPNEREKFYIQKLLTYVGFENCNGYNATLGGDGTSYAFSTAEEIATLVELYNQKISTTEIAAKLNRDAFTVQSKLRELGFDLSRGRVGRKPVYQLDKKTEEVIKEFESVEAAALELGDRQYKSHIFQVCSGKRKSAYGFKWKYREYTLTCGETGSLTEL
jgi:group I intron endonuclease